MQLDTCLIPPTHNIPKDTKNHNEYTDYPKMILCIHFVCMHACNICAHVCCVHANVICMYACTLVVCNYKMFPHTETYSLFPSSSSMQQDLRKQQKISNITIEQKG